MLVAVDFGTVHLGVAWEYNGTVLTQYFKYTEITLIAALFAGQTVYIEGQREGIQEVKLWRFERILRVYKVNSVFLNHNLFQVGKATKRKFVQDSGIVCANGHCYDAAYVLLKIKEQSS